MPCRSEYMEPSARERESVRVCGLLEELGWPGDYDRLYGSPHTLDIDTRTLCDACKSLGDHNLKHYSLELQIWWRDHQIADQKPEVQQRLKLIAQAKAKLNKEELDALMDLK